MRTPSLVALVVAAAAAPCLAQDAGGRPDFLISPDARFGRGGFVRSIRAGRVRMEGAHWARLDAAGRLVVLGRRFVRFENEGRRAVAVVARYLPDGRLDATFGARGLASLPARDPPSGLAIDGAGRIVVTLRQNEWDARVFAARLRPDGSLDAEFSQDGLVEPPAGGGRGMRDPQIDPTDDSIVGVVDRRDGVVGVVRIAADGAFDETYAGDGIADSVGWPTALAVDSSGRALLSAEPGIVRLERDGSRDLGFGTGGVLALRVARLSVDAQDRIFVQQTVGETPVYGRLLADGGPDETFGPGGVATFPRGAARVAHASDAFVGTSSRGDRIVVGSMTNTFERGPGGRVGDRGGWMIELLDRTAPQRTATYLRRDPSPRRGRMVSLPSLVLVTDDGAAAYVVGFETTRRAGNGPRTEAPFLAKFDLSRLKPRAAPALSVAWMGAPRVESRDGGRFLEGTFRVRNLGQTAAPSVFARVFASFDDVLDPDDRSILDALIVRLTPGERQTVTLPALGADGLTDGSRLIVALQTDVADPRRRVAVSPPVELDEDRP